VPKENPEDYLLILLNFYIYLLFFILSINICFFQGNITINKDFFSYINGTGAFKFSEKVHFIK